MAVIRISKGNFTQEKYLELERKLNDSEKILKPAVGQLEGCLHFYAGIDPVTNSMVNVSIWESLETAKQLDTFDPMLKLAKEFIEAGVEWDRPITNFRSLWEF